MKRRSFIQSASVLAAAGCVSSRGFLPEMREDAVGFTLNYAPHPGMFKHLGGETLEDQLKFIASEGFTAFEDNNMATRDVETQKKLGALMAEEGISMGVFVAHTIDWSEPNLASGDESKRNEFITEINNSVEVAKRTGAKWMTVVPGHLDLRAEMGYQMSAVAETLKRASKILEPHDLIMVLEPLNPRNHPGMFLSTTAQAYQLCKAVDSPACKILYDIYHQQITEGNLIPNIEAAWDEIAYFQIGDNPGRNEPTTGEINFKNVFRFIQEKGYNGILGMEHGNSKPGGEGERAVIKAYHQVDIN